MHSWSWLWGVNEDTILCTSFYINHCFHLMFPDHLVEPCVGSHRHGTTVVSLWGHLIFFAGGNSVLLCNFSFFCRPSCLVRGLISFTGTLLHKYIYYGVTVRTMRLVVTGRTDTVYSIQWWRSIPTDTVYSILRWRSIPTDTVLLNNRSAPF